MYSYIPKKKNRIIGKRKVKIDDEIRFAHEKVVRWQNIRITQLGFVNNIILTLSLAILGFSLSFLEKVSNLCYYETILFICSIILITCSIILAILLNWNRLQDFRETSKKKLFEYRLLKSKKNNDNKDTKHLNKLNEIRKKNKGRSKKTIILLKFQLVSFSIGMTSILITIIYYYRDVLF